MHGNDTLNTIQIELLPKLEINFIGMGYVYMLTIDDSYIGCLYLWVFVF